MLPHFDQDKISCFNIFKTTYISPLSQIYTITYPMARRWALCKIHRGESKGATSSPPSLVSSGPLDSPRWIYTGLTDGHGIRFLFCITFICIHKKKIQFKSSNSFLGNCLFIHRWEELGRPPLSVYQLPWLVAKQPCFCGFVAMPPKVNKSRAHLFSRWARLELTSLAFGEVSSEFNSLNRQPIKRLESARCRIILVIPFKQQSQ